MKIRAAEKKDYGSVPKIMLQAMGDLIFEFIGKKDIQEATAFLCKFYKEKDNQYSYQNTFVMEDKTGIIIGCITAYNGDLLEKLRQPILEHIHANYGISIVPEKETQGNEYYIDTVSVLPSQQGKGVGKSLLTFAIQQAKNQNYKQIGLLVDLKNPNAQRLYSRLGFVLGKKITLLGVQYNHLYLTL